MLNTIALSTLTRSRDDNIGDTFRLDCVAGHHEILSITYATPTDPITRDSALESPRRNSWLCVNTRENQITKATELDTVVAGSERPFCWDDFEKEILGVYVSIGIA